jgi:hypothetical protein
MAKRRFVQINGELIEVTDEYQAPSRNSHNIIGDGHYDGLRAPDGTDISTRTKHREFMKRTGLTTTDDFKSQWTKQIEARNNYRQNGGSISRADVARAMEKLRRS